MGAITSFCCDLSEEPPSREPTSKHQITVVPLPSSPTRIQQKPIEAQDPPKLQQALLTPPQLKQQPQLQQQQQQQFFEIDQFVKERQKSDLQPQKVSLAWFEPLRLLGQGSFATVYLVREKHPKQNLQSVWAMKRISREFTNSKKVMASLLLERRILATAACRFIVGLKYAFADRSYLYLVMEYAEGGDASRLSSGDLRRQLGDKGSAELIKFVVACVVVGLQYLHSSDIIYRDLKPENLLLFANGYLKLSDFGLAKHSPSDSPKCTTLAGTALYNAPEIVLQTGYGRAVDLWALGVLIYELVTTQPPFKLEDVSSKLRFKRVAVQEEVNRKWRGHYLEPVLADLIAGLLRFNAGSRLGSKGFHEIRDHKYFQGFDWEKLREGKLDSPLKKWLEGSFGKIEDKKAVDQQLENRSVCVEEQWDYECPKR